MNGAARAGAVPGRAGLLLRLAVLALQMQFVEPGRQTLGQPPGVGEDQGGVVGLHQFQQPGMDGRPDAAPHWSGRGTRRRRRLDRLAQRGHVGHRDHDLHLKLLAGSGVHHGDGSGHRRSAGTGGEPAQEAGNLVEGTLRG